MAYSDQNHEVVKGAGVKQNGQYRIPGEKIVTKTGLDILYTSQVDQGAVNEDVEKKISSLKHLLEKDPRAADLKWSLFVAASNTYRYDSCLKPFPPMYIKNECKDIEALVLFLIFVEQYITYILYFTFSTEESYRISPSFVCDMQRA